MPRDVEQRVIAPVCRCDPKLARLLADVATFLLPERGAQA